ncbi:protease propeptide/inhibitor [Cyathus striatus]|nr:protease propeptide/inhibitor [Cyathus striatus]
MSNRYIIGFEDHVTQDQIDNYVKDVEDKGAVVSHKFDFTKSFAASIPNEVMVSLQSLQSDGIVKYIEPDGEVKIQ